MYTMIILYFTLPLTESISAVSVHGFWTLSSCEEAAKIVQERNGPPKLHADAFCIRVSPRD